MHSGKKIKETTDMSCVLNFFESNSLSYPVRQTVGVFIYLKKDWKNLLASLAHSHRTLRAQCCALHSA